jgi:UDP-N-acetylmuramoylalanine--D-glutamate ligase
MHKIQPNEIITSKYPICILGGGITGKAVSKFFQRKKIHHFLVDKIKTDDSIPFFSDSSEFHVLPNFSYLIKSPGISPNHPLLIESIKMGKTILSEINLARLFFKGKIIGITGTDGKSTTTALTKHLIQKNFPNTQMGGNIGIPFIELCEESLDYLVLELSSYQLEDSENLDLYASCILNISNDHLERHGTIENYTKAKYKIVDELNKNHFLILNTKLKSIVSNKIQCITKYFGDEEISDIKLIPNQKKIISPIAEYIYDNFKLSGIHNLYNLSAAILLAESCNCDPSIIQEGIDSFKGLSHRFESFGVYNEIEFINDSKSTNTHSLIAGISGYSKKDEILLILGGIPKKEPMDDLINTLNKVQPKIITIYGDFSKIHGKNFQSKLVSDVILVDEFHKILPILKKIVSNKTIKKVIFSPGGASFDYFKNFEERGNIYMEMIKKEFTESV